MSTCGGLFKVTLWLALLILYTRWCELIAGIVDYSPECLPSNIEGVNIKRAPIMYALSGWHGVIAEGVFSVAVPAMPRA